MSRAFRAELTKLIRRRVVVATAALVVMASILATVIVFLAADETGRRTAGSGTTLAELSRPGGATAAFAIGMAAGSVFVFVLFTANWALEFTQGTFRTLLLKQPRRLPLLLGKLTALLAFAAVVLFAAEIATWIVALAMAPIRDVSTSTWFSLSGLREAAGNYANALLGVSAWATLAMALAVLLRSTPLALGVGIAWFGPFEHLVQRAWNAAGGWFPGLILDALAVGGTRDVPYGRTLIFLAGYTVLALAIAGLSFTRRDMTA